MRKEYDTDSKDKLYSMALSDLKTASEPVVTYEVDGYFDTNIGDTVRMQDQEWTPVLYLQARVSEQIRSLTNPKTAKTVFTNYKELTSEISDDLIKRMQDLISKNKVYTCSISTNNGIIFKNGIGSTTLTAYAYNNGVDVSGNLEIRWSKDGTEFYVGRSVTVNAEDVDTKAVYSFVATENGIRRGYYEVTITKVDDGAPGEPGKNGDDGKDGVGIESVTKYYLASEKSTGITVSSPGWTDTKQDMTETKKNLWSYDLIRYTNSTETKTTPVIIGVRGDNGETGDSGIIISPTPPENPKVGQLWQTASGEPIKRWDGSKWVIYYISVENLNVETLSAIAANLGTVTAGLIKDKNGTMLIDVTSGKIISKKIVQGAVENVASLSNAYLAFSGKAPTTDRATMSVNLQNIMFTNENTRKATTIQFEDEMIYARNSVSPRISIYAYRNYDSGTVKGPYTSTNSANNIRVELKRRGCMVTCKITMIAQFPGSGEYGPFNEVKIPVDIDRLWISLLPIVKFQDLTYLEREDTA
jgi:methionine salvage enolase-phosphatase E1